MSKVNKVLPYLHFVLLGVFCTALLTVLCYLRSKKYTDVNKNDYNGKLTNPELTIDVQRLTCKDGMIVVTSRWRNDLTLPAVREIISKAVEDVGVKIMMLEYRSDFADTQPIKVGNLTSKDVKQW